MNRKIKIAITMGDPAGIGPEVACKALADERIRKICLPLIIGDIIQLKQISRKSGLSLRFKGIDSEDYPWQLHGDIPVLGIKKKIKKVTRGKVSKEYGQVSCEYVKEAVRLVTDGRAEAMVTGPICKESWKKAGIPWSGHTELLARLTGTKRYAMMIAGKKLRVVLATIHHPLSRVPHILRKTRMESIIHLADRAGYYLGIKRARIAVCGFNPHAGEGGLLGKEEEEIFKPAVRKMQRRGILVEGPFSADALFFYAAKGKYDIIVASYHDQGLIPLKLLHFYDAVNLTLGLPIVRTSVDHGTAFSIAGKDRAHPGSMKEAIKLAVKMARVKRRDGEMKWE